MWTWIPLIFGTAFAAPEMIPEEDVALEGRTAPSFAMPLMEGGEFNLESERGKPVLLSFWASWCGPCRHELPDLTGLQKKWPNLSVITVNVDREKGPANAFLRKLEGDFDLPVVWDNEARAMGQYHVASMPTLVLIDDKGTVKFVKVGYSREKGFATLETELQKL
jgi:thiol-disulfide isomerase/thioredoxin